MLAYTLHAAREARLVDRVVVSTDGGEIANLSRSFGIEVLERPQALAGSRSPMIDTVLHVLRVLARKRFDPTRVVLLQPTSPFRTGEHVDEALRTFDRKRHESLISVSPVLQHPCECVADREGRLVPAVAPPRGCRGRQDYPELFFVNGAIYITSVRMLTQRRRFWDATSAMYNMSMVHSIDIDDRDQLDLAEALLAIRPELSHLRRAVTSQQRKAS